MNEDNRRILRIVSVIAASVFLVACIVRTGIYYKDYSDEMARANGLLSGLQTDIQRQELIYEQENAEVNAGADIIHSVYAFGSGVADLQNAYVEENADTESIYAGLQRYFDASSCGQWVAWDPLHYSLEWSFMTDFEFTEDSVIVLWSLNGGAGIIYAYATAEYSPSAGRFSDISITRTVAGAEL